MDAFSDLRDDKEYLLEHPGAVPISTSHVTLLILVFFYVSFFFLYASFIHGRV